MKILLSLIIVVVCLGLFIGSDGPLVPSCNTTENFGNITYPWFSVNYNDSEIVANVRYEEIPYDHIFPRKLLHIVTSPEVNVDCTDILIPYVTIFFGIEAYPTLSAFVGMIASVYLIYVIIVELDSLPLGRNIISAYITICSKFSPQSRLKTCTVRSLFLKHPNISVSRKAEGHTHPISAGVRNMSSAFITNFSTAIGKTAYFNQMSASDVRHGREGCRSYYWAKDLSVKASPCRPPQECLMGIVDVDMYLDMPDLLARYPRTYLISTFQPSRAAKTDGEYSYTFNEKSEVEYHVSGGAVYTHEVWNYTADVLWTHTKKYGFHVYTAYNVDKRYLSNDHQMILLQPISTVPSLLELDLGNTLQRLKCVHQTKDGSFIRLHIQTHNGLIISTGKANCYNCATIPAEMDHAISTHVRNNPKIDLSPASVRMLVEGVDAVAASMLVEYHRMDIDWDGPHVAPAAPIQQFQYDPPNYDPCAKPSMIPFMEPIMPGDCYVPDKCYANDKAAIDGRIKDVKPPEIIITEYDTKLIEEFAKFVVPDAMKYAGIPVDNEAVFEKQNRPAQRAILNNAMNFVDIVQDEKIKSFQKSEPYQKITDPRIISTIPGVNKLNYSRYIYPFQAWTTTFDWFAFGKSCLWVATRVAAICAMATSFVLMTDFSRFDGRVSKYLRLLEQVIMMRFYAVEYHAELAELMASQHNQGARTTFGVKYDTGEARCSGSPETAVFNSVDNAFVAYRAKRMSRKPDGSYYTPEEAWNSLGIYGGDDGLTADQDPIIYEKAALEVGQKLEVEKIARGLSGVNFLARYYSPSVWFGGLDSMCDLPRQLAKFHVTVALPPTVSSLRKFSEKILAYSYTDMNTPILGEIIQHVQTHHPRILPDKINEGLLAGVGYYHADTSEQYPNLNFDDWMTDICDKQLSTFSRQQFLNWLEGCIIDCSKYLSVPRLFPLKLDPPVVKKPVVLNGEVLVPKIGPPPPVLRNVCKYWKETGKCKKMKECKFASSHT